MPAACSFTFPARYLSMCLNPLFFRVPYDHFLRPISSGLGLFTANSQGHKELFWRVWPPENILALGLWFYLHTTCIPIASPLFTSPHRYSFSRAAGINLNLIHT
ncbi:hypothetical protein DFH09DRAFT_1292130 [Mycena vulgaris]|nr:hypothetical protein DFH09DRAFT_1292130 [Mycena vulgaris]